MDTSHYLDAKLEEADPIEIPYVLEVSSPGLDRPLKKDKDFIRSCGKLVEVKLFQANQEGCLLYTSYPVRRAVSCGWRAAGGDEPDAGGNAL